MKIAVYTSIFGGYDDLMDDQFKMDGVDYICFTDMDITSNLWNIVKSTPIYSDSNRNAKKYKILPHRYLQDYDFSIWIDGNIKIISDVREIISSALGHILNDYLVFDHNQNILDPRDCIYEEYNAIIQLGNNNNGNYKDNPVTMNNQVQRYLNEGYPKNNGLTQNSILLRNHNNKKVRKVLEDWWQEIKYNSKRDQLSFNYIAWKNDFKFTYLQGDSRNNKYFYQTGPHKKKRK
jgi:hypothetical protein